MNSQLKGVCKDLMVYEHMLHKHVEIKELKPLLKPLLKALESRYHVKDWLPSKTFKSQKTRKDVYKFLCMEDLEIGNGYAFYKAVDPDNGTYGKNIPHFYESFRGQLQNFRDISNKKMLDIGSALGMTVWKSLLNGFHVTAVDIAYQKSEPLELIKLYVSTRAPQQFDSKLKILSDDMFDLSVKYPSFQGTYDLINVQNVFHFYDLESIDKMIKVMHSMLKIGGMAVVTTEMIDILEVIPCEIDCVAKIDEFKAAQKAPYMVTVHEKNEKIVDVQLISSYPEENLIQHDKEKIWTKTFFDLDSLKESFENNGFEMVTPQSENDYIYGVRISLVVTKVGDVIDLGEL